MNDVERLIKLTRDWNRHDLVPDNQKKACREIGIALNDAGGLDAMRSAYHEAKDHNPDVHVIQAYWDGIGEWRW